MSSDRQNLAFQWLLKPILDETEQFLLHIEDGNWDVFVDALPKFILFFTPEIEALSNTLCAQYEAFKKEKTIQNSQNLANAITNLSENLNTRLKPEHLSKQEITLLQYAATELMMIRDLVQVESEDFCDQAAFGLESLSKSLSPISKRASDILSLMSNYLKGILDNKAEKVSADGRGVIARIIIATEIFVENLINLEFKFESIFDRVEADIFWISSHVKTEEKVSIDPEILAIFLDELKEEVQSINSQLGFLSESEKESDAIKTILNSIHTIKGSSFIVGAKNLSSYSEEIENLLKAQESQRTLSVDDINEVVQFFCDEIIEHVNSPDGKLDITRSVQNILMPEEKKAGPVIEIDPELLAIFFDESQDIMVRVSEAFKSWRKNASDSMLVADLHRELHTLKGGARMVGQESLADLSHELERLYNFLSESKDIPSEEDFNLIEDCHDKISNMLDDFKEKKSIPSSFPFIQKLREHFGLSSDDSSKSISVKIKKNQDIAISKISQTKEEHSDRKQTQEMVRVNASELETLYHFAGEASASRSYLEQNLSSLNYAFSDLILLSKRLTEQIRQLEIQTDLQLLNQPMRTGTDSNSEFDPIEFDRYSRIQQLTRNMGDTLSEILNRRDEQHKIIKILENGFQVQEKTQNQLRLGLLRTQMVYFSSIMPRLTRIVKQTADELGKKCELISNKMDFEIDRNLLNHIIAPLEHMLRNAVDHGLETADKRKENGKDEVGKIILSLRREGGEIFIDVSDDGAGISVESVRQNAIRKGLMREDENLNKTQILRFILESGFSTKSSVTQISGRGVGMDVVYNEVKQLGGHLLIETEEGKGTLFTIHLPFTQSLHRTLVFRVQNVQYALQLSSIKAIARLSPEQAEKFISEPGSLYEHGDESYAIIYCGNLLAADKTIRKPKKNKRYPLLLLRTRGANLGLFVDEIEGSREVLLKSLSPELRQLRFLAGATELSEGMLSFILDPEGLVEKAESLYRTMMLGSFEKNEKGEKPLSPHQKQHMPQNIKVLVVDDSMTVRRVTTRFLTARGFKVQTAKDGMDALSVMRTEKPDVILMDIEMPRMDGFECVAKMKEDELLKDIPVIMISSRTGQKHRDRAASLGVEVGCYFGKPYQEDAVFKAIMVATEGKL